MTTTSERTLASEPLPSPSPSRSRFRPPRRVLLGSGLVLLVVVLAVAGASVLAVSDADRVATAGTRTTEEGTAQVSMITVLRSSERVEQRTQAAGLIDFRARRTAFRVRVGLPSEAGGEGQSSVPLLTVTDGATTYLRSPQWPDSQPWVRYADQDADGEQGVSTGYDLGGQLELLLGAASAPEALGEEAIRNVTTRHYRVTVDLEQAAAAGDAEQAAALQQVVERTGGALPLELWIDEPGRVRRLTYSLDMAGAEDESTTVDTQVEYYDFGVEADVAVPELTVDYSPPQAAEADPAETEE